MRAFVHGFVSSCFALYANKINRYERLLLIIAAPAKSLYDAARLYGIVHYAWHCLCGDAKWNVSVMMADMLWFVKVLVDSLDLHLSIFLPESTRLLGSSNCVRWSSIRVLIQYLQQCPLRRFRVHLLIRMNVGPCSIIILYTRTGWVNSFGGWAGAKRGASQWRGIGDERKHATPHSS